MGLIDIFIRIVCLEKEKVFNINFSKIETFYIILIYISNFLLFKLAQLFKYFLNFI